MRIRCIVKHTWLGSWLSDKQNCQRLPRWQKSLRESAWSWRTAGRLPLTTSIMPQGLQQDLTDDDLRDLLALLGE